MRKLGMTAVMALSLGSSGCGMLVPAPASAPPLREAAGDLRTMIMPTGTSYDESLAFQVNRAAYAAVFRIVPGQGAMMIYPRPGFGARDGFLFSGFHRVVAAGPGSSFVSTLDGGVPPAWQTGAEYGPEYYLVIVSERPLRLDGRMYGFDSWLRSANGGPAMMSWIASQIVPDKGAADWTTDYYVHWPEAISSMPTAGLIPLNCGGKRVWANPEQYDRAVSVLCGEGERAGDPARPRPDAGQPQAGDVTGPVEPRRREPVPAATESAERIVSRQLQEPEAWEQARRTVAERRRPAVAADRLPADLSQPAAASEIERMLREAERIEGMRDGVDPFLDSPDGRVRPVTEPWDGDLTRPGFDPPRLRPTFEIPEPTAPPSFEGAAPAVEPPPPPPAIEPVERVPSDSSPGEGVTRRRPVVE